jgi:hypothetical protein
MDRWLCEAAAEASGVGAKRQRVLGVLGSLIGRLFQKKSRWSLARVIFPPLWIKSQAMPIAAVLFLCPIALIYP